MGRSGMISASIPAASLSLRNRLAPYLKDLVVIQEENKEESGRTSRMFDTIRITVSVVISFCKARRLALLNDGSLRNRIGKGDSDFNDITAVLFQLLHTFHTCGNIRITCCQKADEAVFCSCFNLLNTASILFMNVHLQIFRNTFTSLSPRPDRVTASMLSLDMVGASFMA